MTELRTLHLTDIHDDFEKYQVLAAYIASKKDSDQAVDAVFITGDFIEGHIIKDKTAFNIVEGIKSLSKNPSKEEEELKAFLQRHQKDGKIDLNTLDEAQKKEFETLDAKISARIEELVNKIVSGAYQIHADKISALGVPVYGIMGN
ncbi:MAG TPA: hypothetical protein VJB13_00945, partial [Candidatus Nanoarchaeia archaeon]|nr:hypothetical protein [Candidatus Nanoarchaeia archaeon]